MTRREARFYTTLAGWIVVIAAFFFVVALIDRSKAEPQFHRNDRVEVVSGFWTGWTGKVLTCQQTGGLGWQWSYGVDVGITAVVIEEDRLREVVVTHDDSIHEPQHP